MVGDQPGLQRKLLLKTNQQSPHRQNLSFKCKCPHGGKALSLALSLKVLICVLWYHTGMQDPDGAKGDTVVLWGTSGRGQLWRPWEGEGHSKPTGSGTVVSELKCILDPALPEVSVSHSTTPREPFTGLRCQDAGERQDPRQ